MTSLQPYTSSIPSTGRDLHFACTDLHRETGQFVDALETNSDLVSYLREIKASGILAKILPELAATWGERGRQDSKWHPEGDVWTHTLLVLAGLPADSSFILKTATVFHDVGKPLTFFQYPDNGGITNHGHAHAGAEMFRSSIGPRLGLSAVTCDAIAYIIDHHMIMHDALNSAKVSDKLLAEILKSPYARDMIYLQHADAMGTAQSIESRLKRSGKEYLLCLAIPSPEREK